MHKQPTLTIQNLIGFLPSYSHNHDCESTKVNLLSFIEVKKLKTFFKMLLPSVSLSNLFMFQKHLYLGVLSFLCIMKTNLSRYSFANSKSIFQFKKCGSTSMKCTRFSFAHTLPRVVKVSCS